MIWHKSMLNYKVSNRSERRKHHICKSVILMICYQANILLQNIVKKYQNCLDLTLLPIPDTCAYITLNLKLTYKARIQSSGQKKIFWF